MKIYRKTEIFITLLFIGGVPTKQPSPPLAGELCSSSPALNMNSCDNFCFLLVKKSFLDSFSAATKYFFYLLSKLSNKIKFIKIKFFQSYIIDKK